MVVPITYRTDGPWGAGKGANLTAVEVDENFAGIQSKLEELETDPPTPVGIAQFDVTGNTFTVTLSDASVFGPFPLPKVYNAWQDEWEPGRTYVENDMFSVANMGIYLVLTDYEAGTVFDPDVFGTDGPLLQLLFGLPPQNYIPVKEVALDSGLYTLLAEDAGKVLRFTNTGSVEVVVPATGLEDSPVGALWTIRGAGTGVLSWLNEDTSVVLNYPDSLILRKQHSTSTCQKVGDLEYDMSGDLLLEIVSG